MNAENDMVSRLKAVVAEIKGFYDRCNQVSESRIRLTTGMLSYALGLSQPGDVYAILGMLEKQGYDFDATDEYVTFPSSFINTAA